MHVSIVIPCRDAAAVLAESLSSALEQTRPPNEVIVVDDGSTDESLSVAHAAAAADPRGRIRVVAGPHGGAPAARHAGARVANGDALMFLDADDLLGPTALEALVAVLEAHPGAIARCPWYRWERRFDQWLAAPASCAPKRPGQDDLEAWLLGWYHPPCSILWSLRAFERSGGWDPSVAVNNDGDIMMRALLAGVELVPTDSGAAFYRRAVDAAQTVSGRRWTERGVRSRFEVISRIAECLDRQGRIDRYRSALSEALDRLADGSRQDHPELSLTCRRAATRIGGPGAVRGMRRVGRRLLSRHAAPHSVQGPGPRSAGVTWPAKRRVVADDGTPRVSVIVPTFDRAHVLLRAVKSVLSQTFSDFELLVIDDASRDATEAVVRSERDPRIRYLRQPYNGGAGAARNRGLAVARGELIAFLDSDDEWHPDKLRRQIGVFDRGDLALGLVYSGIEEAGEDGRSVVVLPHHRGDVYRAMLADNVIYGGGSNAMIRRSVVARVGGFDEALPAIEDYDLWLRIARFYRVDFVPEPLARYHAPPRGAQRLRVSKNLAKNLEARARFFEKHRPDMEAAGAAQAFLLEGARRHLRESDGDPWAGRRLVARALACRPTTLRLYPWLPYMLLPADGQRSMRELERDVRRLFARRGALS